MRSTSLKEGRNELIKKNRLLAIIAAVLFWIPLAGLSLAPEQYSKSARIAADKVYLIATGRLPEVGGYRLHIECRGTGDGPTIIYEAGLNQTIESWGKVPNETAKFARSCTYERRGLGMSSELQKSRRTTLDVDEDLIRLLEAEGIEGKIILVGHSFGGICARYFAARHPGRISGLVLVDPSHERQYRLFADLKHGKERTDYLRHEGGKNGEHLDLLKSAEEVAALRPLRSDLPLIVLSARPKGSDPEDPYLKINERLHTELGEISRNGKTVVVQDCGHFIQLEKPGAVVKAVRTVFEKVRNSKS
ncbi:MAG: alpha/beta hydrolase [Acidobacteriota bacterium]|nr:MAG: alpha/beta hydrolase [Acidobacteriota bacterium]